MLKEAIGSVLLSAAAADGTEPCDPKQQAVVAVPAPGGGQRPLVRRREAAGVAFVAAGRREQREQPLEIGQRQVAQHVLAGFRAIGRERNEQVHAAIIRVASRCGGRGGSGSIAPA